MTTATRARGITPRQIAFILDLAAKLTGKEVGDPALDVIRERLDGLTTREASSLIDDFKEKLREARAAERAERFKTPDLEPGFYEHDGKVYEVVRSVNDRLYANLLDTERGQFVRAKGAIYQLSKAGSKPLTLQEAAGISRRLKRCIVCGHKLKRLDSQERGIGPVCAKRFD